MSWTDSEMARMGTWGNRLSSLKIEKVETPTAIETVGSEQPRTESNAAYDVLGRRFPKGNRIAISVTKGRKQTQTATLH